MITHQNRLGGRLPRRVPASRGLEGAHRQPAGRVEGRQRPRIGTRAEQPDRGGEGEDR